MELRQLEYFQKVCLLNSITKAAEELHVSQPSISIALQKLEREFGLPLFDRNQKQLSLTENGKVFLQRTNDILTRVKDTSAEMRDRKRLQGGTINIGIPPMIGSMLFPPILAKFRKAYPNLQLKAFESGSLTIREQLEQGTLDIGIISTGKVLSSRLGSISIREEELLVCLPQGHPLGAFARISLQELKNEPFILLEEDTFIRQTILEECRRQNFSPEIVLSSSQIQTIVGLVEERVGISFLLDTILKNQPHILSRPFANPIYVQIVLAWNNDRYLSKASKAFIDFITLLQK